MASFKIGDIVVRRSYGGDIFFRVVNIKNNDNGKVRYVLRGLTSRIEADSEAEDLVKQDTRTAYANMHKEFNVMKTRLQGSVPAFRSFFSRLGKKPGTILHIDSAQDFMNQCMDFYKQSNINCFGKWVSESNQPSLVGRYLLSYKPDILILTGHDGLKKDAKNIMSVDSYANSRYYIESVKIARQYQPDPDKLCIFAGACQSYYEALMQAGANFASSPKRVLINSLDPAIIAQKVSVTDSANIIIPSDVIPLTITGVAGIGGKNTRGQLK